MTIHMLLSGVFSLALLTGSSSAAEHGCPPHSHEVGEVEVGGRTRVTCHCDSGYAKVDAACKPVNAARAQLAKRHRDALRGMESSLASLRDDVSGQVFAALKDKIVAALTSIAAAIATKDVRLLSRTGGAALVAVTYVMVEGGEQMKTCRFSNEGVRTACLNANTFRQIAETSLKQFEATFP